MSSSLQSRILAACCSLLGLVLGSAESLAQDEALARNHIVVDDRLHTSGQPSAEMLSTLGERGFETVVNLAPPTSQGAVSDERERLERAGVTYVNIPVDFRNPTYEDFERFSAAMMEARDGRTLVHCQVNARASTFTFLYRVVHEGVAPDEAFPLVQQVWTPIEPWARFGEEVLARHGIEFDIPVAETASR